MVFFKNFLIYYEHKAAVCGILLSLFLQTKTVFLLSPCQSRYLLWFNELSKNRRIQSSFVSRKWRSWVSRFFTYCLINQTQTQWDFCVVGLYNLGLYWKKNSKVYAYKGLVFQSFSPFAQWKFPWKVSKLPYSIIYIHQILKFLSPVFIMKNGKSYLSTYFGFSIGM